MRRRRRALLAVAVGAPVLVAAAVFAAVGGGGASGCEAERFPEQRARHLPELPEGFAYNSFPPTSGPSADAPLVWDVYDEPVPQFSLVHNLFHGGVAVQYGDRVPREAVRRIAEWYEADPDATVVAPLPRLGADVAVTAWRNLLRCDGFHERSFTGFRTQHRFNGPERPPREELRRGEGGQPNALGLRIAPDPVRTRATISFAFDTAASVALVVRRSTALGPVVARVATTAVIPGRPVRLLWEPRDGEGRRLPERRYALVATADARITAVVRFEVEDAD